MRRIFFLLLLIAPNALSSEFIGETPYEITCLTSGWSCHKVSKKERIHLLQLLRKELSEYQAYFLTVDNIHQKGTAALTIYEKASSVCQKIYLLEPGASDCNTIHCKFHKERWIPSEISFAQSFKEDC